MTDRQASPKCLEDIRAQRETLWIRHSIAGKDALGDEISPDEVIGAAQRLERFAPVLSVLFSEVGWDGRIRSDLVDLSAAAPGRSVWLKADHGLPMTGSIKARGGVHEVLASVEQIGLDCGLLDGGNYLELISSRGRSVLERYTLSVASTGNLGFSVGLIARAFGLATEVHMSHEAKRWKKDRLCKIGAKVVEYPGDYSETVAGARSASVGRPRCYFVDDETSRRLFTGYAVAARELADQLLAHHVRIGPRNPLVVYLPCGVGGAPGGIAFGLKQIFDADVICVFVEPVASACMMVALASQAQEPPSVYDFGGTNITLADGLAVPRASELVISAVGSAIDVVVAVDDAVMIDSVRWAWRTFGLRLEPAAAASLAGRQTLARLGTPNWWPTGDVVEVAWATGGALLPESEFHLLLAQ